MADNEDKVLINYSANSNKSKEPAQPAAEKVEKKDLAPIEGAKASARKKPLGSKIAETFTGDDAASVGDYVLLEVVVPAAKNLLVDVVREGLERLLYGTSGGGRARSSGSRPHIAYNMASKKTAVVASEPRRLSREAKAAHDFREVVFETRGDAELALDRLREALSEYENVTVADMYELAGITADFPDHNWGWIGNDLNQARVKPVSAGYLLDMPMPRQLR